MSALPVVAGWLHLPPRRFVVAAASAGLLVAGTLAAGATTADPTPVVIASEVSDMFVHDRVGPYEVAPQPDADPPTPGSLAPDEVPDGRFWLDVQSPGEHVVSFIQVRSGGSIWDTPYNGNWVVGVTDASLGAPFLNTVDQGIAAPFTDEKALYLYMADNGSLGGTAFDVEVCIDGAAAEQAPPSVGCAVVAVDTTPDADEDGWTRFQGDCDDADVDVHPGATDAVGNDVDENCDGVDGVAATGTDSDVDGYTTPGDCDDTDAAVNPGASEAYGNGKDDNCDGKQDEGFAPYYADADSDGYGDASATATYATSAPSGSVGDSTDCDDTDDAVNPGASEAYGNSKDDNCDGQQDEGFSAYYTDADSDGYGDASATATYATSAPSGSVGNSTDCADGDPGIHPGATDVPGDGVDQDCTGTDAAPYASTVTYAGATQGKGKRAKQVTFSASVGSDATSCRSGRSVTFTVRGEAHTVSSGSTGVATSVYDVTAWPTAIYAVTVELPASTDGACAADADGASGSWSYRAKGRK